MSARDGERFHTWIHCYSTPLGYFPLHILLHGLAFHEKRQGRQNVKINSWTSNYSAPVSVNWLLLLSMFLVIRGLVRKDVWILFNILFSLQLLLLCAPHSFSVAYAAFTAPAATFLFLPFHPSTHREPTKPVVLIKGICEAMYLNISLRIEPRQQRRMT